MNYSQIQILLMKVILSKKVFTKSRVDCKYLHFSFFPFLGETFFFFEKEKNPNSTWMDFSGRKKEETIFKITFLQRC